MALKIKKEFENEVVGFNGSVTPVGARSQADLRDLAMLAHNNPTYRPYFEQLPTMKQLLDTKGDDFLEKYPAPAVSTTKTSDGDGK